MDRYQHFYYILIFLWVAGHLWLEFLSKCQHTVQADWVRNRWSEKRPISLYKFLQISDASTTATAGTMVPAPTTATTMVPAPTTTTTMVPAPTTTTTMVPAPTTTTTMVPAPTTTTNTPQPRPQPPPPQPTTTVVVVMMMMMVVVVVVVVVVVMMMMTTMMMMMMMMMVVVVVVVVIQMRWCYGYFLEFSLHSIGLPGITIWDSGWE